MPDLTIPRVVITSSIRWAWTDCPPRIRSEAATMATRRRRGSEPLISALISVRLRKRAPNSNQRRMACSSGLEGGTVLVGIGGGATSLRMRDQDAPQRKTAADESHTQATAGATRGARVVITRCRARRITYYKAPQ